MAEQPQTYLGDGLYATFDGYQVWIYASNGVDSTQPVALEPETLAALNAFAERCGMPK